MAMLDIRVPDKFKKELGSRSHGQHRKLSDQVRRYLEIAMVAEDNPDLPFSFISGILEAKAQKEAGLLEPLDWNTK